MASSSRIPHHSSRAAHGPLATTDVTEDDSDSAKFVYESLLQLGAPRITFEEFQRLYRGPLAEALLFLSRHVRGRQEVAAARGRIQRWRETRSKTRIKRSDDATRSPVDKAEVLLSGARKTAEECRKRLEDKQIELDGTQRELDNLRAQLHERRRTALLLEILEEKEKVRLERLSRLTRMLGELKQTIAAVEKEPLKLDIPSPQENDLTLGPLQPFRLHYTRDALATMHLYHARIARTMASKQPSIPEARQRLRAVLGKNQSEAEKIISRARTRARKMMQFREVALPEHISSAELDKKQAKIEDKERELQKLINTSVGLGYLCEHLISSMNVFNETTSVILRKSLDEESLAAKGYVDHLRVLIAAQPNSNDIKSMEFTHRVQDVCKIRGPLMTETLVAEIEALIRQSHRRRTFLTTTTPSQASSMTPEEDEQISVFDKRCSDVEEHAIALLSRKVDKAEKGYWLVEDVRKLLQETRRLAG